MPGVSATCIAAACASWLALPITKFSKDSSGLSLFWLLCVLGSGNETVGSGSAIVAGDVRVVGGVEFPPIRNSKNGGLDRKDSALLEISGKKRSCITFMVKLLGAVRVIWSPFISKASGLIHELNCWGGAGCL